MAHDLNLRVLVLAQFGRDSELLQTFLKRHNFYSHVVSSAEELLKELERGAGIGIVTEESFNMPLESWTRRLAMQPSWSDFPLIVLTGAGESWVPSPYLAELRCVGNVTLVERPIRSDSLLSAVESAMRARMRQYEVRDFLRRQADSEEALRRTEKLAVAGRLAASLAHEINNPLTAVTNLLFLIRGSRDLAEAKKYATQAEDELRRVTEIANHTLRFHRSSHGPELVEVAPLLDSAVSLFKAKLRNQNIKVKIECNEPCRATFVLGEIRQVLVNLIANAIDAMPRGGGLLVRGLTRPHPGTAMPGLRITVADHGDGIPPKALPRLFEPFFTTKGSTGTGLGLWLTKDIIDRHQGFIRMRNHHRPHGAVFSFWIPEKPATQAL
ncbi:MAG TPA: HAMP domain-containing sensor histidine kinase [Candidatus Angelobacter sp.]|nr:HAMP domain-containing sensor histidine kinase [Candidatus Angelobacter sp.]